MSETNATQNAPQGAFSIERIYIKDISFEAPNTPEVFRQEWKPEVKVDMHTKHTALEDNLHEVVLQVTVKLDLAGKTAYLVEVHQAGIFTIKDFPEDRLPHLVGSFCPDILYPYAREKVSDLVTAASFPQLNLAPVNFDALFMQQMEQEAAKAKQAGETAH